MKKQLLTLGLIAVTAISVKAQNCITDGAIIDAELASRPGSPTWGAIPDTIVNLPVATVGAFYDTPLSFLLPNKVGDLDPTNIAASSDLDDIRISNIGNLPPGFSFISRADATDGFFCDGLGANVQGSSPQECWWEGGAYGCVRLEGTPTPAAAAQSGGDTTYYLEIELIGAATVPFVGRQEGTGNLPGYKIVIQGGTTSIADNSDDAFKVSQNVPNPFNGVTKINYATESAAKVNFEVINLLGERVYENVYSAKDGINSISFDGSNLNDGIYMYTLTIGNKKVTKRMVVNN